MISREDFRKFLACEKNSARYTFFEDRQKKKSQIWSNEIFQNLRQCKC